MTEQPPTTSGAVRLIFEYDGDTVRLISQTPVDVDIPRPAPTEEPADHFVESRSVAGTVLARVPVRGAFQQSAEVFPEDHEEAITRVDAAAQGAFTVVVPADDEAVRVAVMRAGRARTDRDLAPGQGVGADDLELGSFPLHGKR
ncbi:hypothetical protein [Terrabacter sp. 2YAF2]|uniref:hypothetical protein n=1 Tax=Terrabacter sp. 2YAF2 TaxID=3233026 RepID=UPI003F989951